MAAHRYWGLYVTARAGSGNGVTVGEIEMRGTPGGADLCTGGTAPLLGRFHLRLVRVAGHPADARRNHQPAPVVHRSGAGSGREVHVNGAQERKKREWADC